MGAKGKPNTGPMPPVEHRFKPGQSGNPSGRPKSKVSITHWLNEFGAMTTAEAAKACELYAKELRKHNGGDVPIVGLIALRALMQLIDEPTPGLFGHILDRIDGEVGAAPDGAKKMTIRVVYEDARNGTEDTAEIAARETTPSLS